MAHTERVSARPGVSPRTPPDTAVIRANETQAPLEPRVGGRERVEAIHPEAEDLPAPRSGFSWGTGGPCGRDAPQWPFTIALAVTPQPSISRTGATVVVEMRSLRSTAVVSRAASSA